MFDPKKGLKGSMNYILKLDVTDYNNLNEYVLQGLVDESLKTIQKELNKE